MTEKKKKIPFRVYQFDPMIYPRFLWVVTGGDYSDMKKWFLDYSGEEIEELNIENMGGMTDCVTFRQNLCLGILIWFPDIRLAKANWITHESVHGTLELFDQLGLRVDFRNQEPVAYLAGWIAECIELVKLGRVKALKLEETKDENDK